jgi:serine/threonine protein phosphatase PrpC
MRNGSQPHSPAIALDAATASDAAAAGTREDARFSLHCATPTQVLVAIADGTGSPEGVELASHRALSALLSTYRELPAGTPLTQRMMRAARTASFAAYELAVVLPQLREVSTTLTAVAVAGERMTAAHVGDGRVYLRRDGTLTQLSKDPTVAAEAMAAQGSHAGPDGERLTRALGRHLLVPIDIFEMELRPGDGIVICTHGIHRALPEAALGAALEHCSATEACHRLVEEAQGKGPAAGLSVGIVRVLGSPVGAAGPRA